MRQVFLHGLGQTPEDWRETILQLQSGECSMCPDLAAILQGNDTTYQNLYKALSAICSQIDEKIDFCGLSLGGVLSLHYAIEHPRKINSLVLIAPQYKMPKNLLRVQNLLFRLMPKAAFRSTGFEKKAFIRLCGTMMELDFSSALANVTCPTLILCGERDSANKKAAEKLAGSLKNAEMQEITGAGHEVNKDAPEKLSRALSDFYRRIQ